MCVCEATCVPVCSPLTAKTPPQTLTDRRGMFNCRLLRPAVIGLICHRARLAGRQEEVGVRGVTPPRVDDRTGAPAKPTAGPVLLLWSIGIFSARRRFQGRNITALITLQKAVLRGGIFPA